MFYKRRYNYSRRGYGRRTGGYRPRFGGGYRKATPRWGAAAGFYKLRSQYLQGVIQGLHQAENNKRIGKTKGTKRAGKAKAKSTEPGFYQQIKESKGANGFTKLANV